MSSPVPESAASWAASPTSSSRPASAARAKRPASAPQSSAACCPRQVGEQRPRAVDLLVRIGENGGRGRPLGPLELGAEQLVLGAKDACRRTAHRACAAPARLSRMTWTPLTV